jgi:hypothetical protein
VTAKQLEFRRCPRCRRVEEVATKRVLLPGDERCQVNEDHWVYFTAPPDWVPATTFPLAGRSP